ncbi:hypothetical protein [Desulfobotulus alkaliphilus]
MLSSRIEGTISTMDEIRFGQERCFFI